MTPSEARVKNLGASAPVLAESRRNPSRVRSEPIVGTSSRALALSWPPLLVGYSAIILAEAASVWAIVGAYHQWTVQ